MGGCAPSPRVPWRVNVCCAPLRGTRAGARVRRGYHIGYHIGCHIGCHRVSYRISQDGLLERCERVMAETVQRFVSRDIRDACVARAAAA